MKGIRRVQWHHHPARHFVFQRSAFPEHSVNVFLFLKLTLRKRSCSTKSDRFSLQRHLESYRRLCHSHEPDTPAQLFLTLRTAPFSSPFLPSFSVLAFRRLNSSTLPFPPFKPLALIYTCQGPVGWLSLMGTRPGTARHAQQRHIHAIFDHRAHRIRYSTHNLRPTTSAFDFEFQTDPDVGTTCDDGADHVHGL
ncbi:hypothetical protein CPC08DRAFT_327595 [Agrocybe pediades]|nr:hypothetical protein CPC08DRAFT_327595 [Agrocybe pediades]